jgi:putative flippase GtrA
VKEFLKFALTGGLGTLTNLAIFFVFADLLKLNAVPVSAGCFVIAATQNYFFNHLWSFRAQTGSEAPSLIKWLKFMAGSLLGLAINLSVLKLVILYFDPAYKFIAQACGIAAGMIINFLISKFFVFRKKGKQ